MWRFLTQRPCAISHDENLHSLLMWENLKLHSVLTSKVVAFSPLLFKCPVWRLEKFIFWTSGSSFDLVVRLVSKSTLVTEWERHCSRFEWRSGSNLLWQVAAGTEQIPTCWIHVCSLFSSFTADPNVASRALTDGTLLLESHCTSYSKAVRQLNTVFWPNFSLCGPCAVNIGYNIFPLIPL